MGGEGKQTHTHRQRHTDTHTHRHTDTDTDTQTHTHRHTHTDTQTHRHTHTDRHTDTHTDTHRHRPTDTRTHKHTGRHTQTPPLRGKSTRYFWTPSPGEIRNVQMDPRKGRKNRLSWENPECTNGPPEGPEKSTLRGKSGMYKWTPGRAGKIDSPGKIRSVQMDPRKGRKNRLSGENPECTNGPPEGPEKSNVFLDPRKG